jgi:glycosyltransferase involved in cell wall biosynthesis
MSDRVIYLVRSWPRLSQTFILNEVLALERRGIELDIFSLVRSGEEVVQPRVAEVRASVSYLEDARRLRWRERIRPHLVVLVTAPVRYLRSLVFSLRHPRLSAGYGDCSTLRCFAYAVQVALAVARRRASGQDVGHVHAHFAHDPALVALLVTRLTGVPFSFTGHARDLYQIPAISLAARSAEATTVVTCCRANADYLSSVLPRRHRPPVRVIHHGVDLDRFGLDPRQSGGPVPELVCVGRLVEKKGHVDLLTALSLLKSSGAAFSCRIYGEGPLQDTLRRLGADLGLDEHVAWMGPCSSEQVAAALAAADAFVLTPIHTEDGDRDGIPNVLVEAMASGLPVVTTSAGGITELVEHQANGLVTAPGNVTAIAASIGRLLDDPGLRRRLGSAARRTVESDYDIDVAARELEHVFRAGTSSELEARD